MIALLISGSFSSSAIQELCSSSSCIDYKIVNFVAPLIQCSPLCSGRYCTIPTEDDASKEGQRDSSGAALESTTLHIFSPEQSSQRLRELYISDSQDEAECGEMERGRALPKEPQLLCTELHVASSGDRLGRGPVFKLTDEDPERCLSPGDTVELQVSLSEQTLNDVGCTSLGSALGVQRDVSDGVETVHTTTASHSVKSVREPLSQHGLVLSSPVMLGQVEVILGQPAASGAGRGILSVGGPEVSGSIGSQSEGEEGGGHYEGVPGSFTVSFGIPSEETTAAEEQDSDSEGDQDKPHKHRAKHASKYPRTFYFGPVCVPSLCLWVTKIYSFKGQIAS